MIVLWKKMFSYDGFSSKFYSYLEWRALKSLIPSASPQIWIMSSLVNLKMSAPPKLLKVRRNCPKRLDCSHWEVWDAVASKDKGSMKICNVTQLSYRTLRKKMKLTGISSRNSAALGCWALWLGKVPAPLLGALSSLTVSVGLLPLLTKRPNKGKAQICAQCTYMFSTGLVNPLTTPAVMQVEFTGNTTVLSDAIWKSPVLWLMNKKIFVCEYITSVRTVHSYEGWYFSCSDTGLFWIFSLSCLCFLSAPLSYEFKRGH